MTPVQRLLWERRVGLLMRRPISTPEPQGPPEISQTFIGGCVVALHAGWVTWIDDDYDESAGVALRTPAEVQAAVDAYIANALPIFDWTPRNA